MLKIPSLHHLVWYSFNIISYKSSGAPGATISKTYWSIPPDPPTGSILDTLVYLRLIPHYNPNKYDPCIVPLNIMFLVGVHWSVIAVPEVDASNGDGLDGSTLEGSGASALPRLYRDTDPP